MKTCITFLLVIFISCFHSHDGFVGVSKNIKESKNRGAFIATYKAEFSPILKKYSFYPTDEIWLEKLWRYKKFNKTSFKNTAGHKQIKINFKNETPISTYGDQWFLGITYELNFRKSSRTSLMADFKGIVPDTIRIPIQKKNSFQKEKQQLIGELILVKNEETNH